MRPGDRFTTSVGQPLPGVEVRIAPGARRRPAADAADDGEILIRGPIVMREVLPPAGRHRRGAQRRLAAHRATSAGSTSRGRLYITGRQKDVIVLSSGKNIYPEEIEAHYRRRPFVKETLRASASAGPATPSAERLHALVVPDDAALRDARHRERPRAHPIRARGPRVHLPAHKRILGYDICRDPLPRTTTGKLEAARRSRRAVGRADRRRATRASADRRGTGLACRPGDHRALADIVAARLKLRVVRPTTTSNWISTSIPWSAWNC